ncbi:MAG: hypothetical protein KAJ18_07260 [Candidatus Omnitrophica bacterium]|nr:hypothetical protein [Candidatus Omnitrophota bacterium]
MVTIPLPDLAKDITIISLLVGIFTCMAVIQNLKKALHIEKHKRTVPLLAIKISDYEGCFLLKNTSQCPAKNIRVQDINITVDYDFKKDITLTFPSIPDLNPDEEKPLIYQAYDGRHKIPPEKNKEFFALLSNQTFSWNFHYSNLEGIPFTAIIEQTKNQFHLKETRATKEI